MASNFRRHAEKTTQFLEGNGLDIIFIGNPGVGKSTLGSTVSGNNFESGVSFGEGLTVMKEVHHDMKKGDDGKLRNIRWIDTPGLADTKMRRQAAKEIEDALRQGMDRGRAVKIYFIQTLDCGRTRPADILTVNEVMTNITLADGSKPGPNSYGIIFNKIPFHWIKDTKIHNQLKSKIEGYYKINSEEMDPDVVCAKIPTDRIAYFPEEDASRYEPNVKLFNSSGLKKYVDELEHFIILEGEPLQIEKVDKLDVEAANANRLEKMQQHFMDQQKRMYEEFDKKREEWAKREKALEDERDNYKNKWLEQGKKLVGKAVAVATPRKGCAIL